MALESVVFYLSPANLARRTQARLACPLTDGLSLVTVLPLHLWCNFAHLCPGTIFPNAIHLLRPCHHVLSARPCL
ncbi:hypothetical protein CLIM01_08145 [Colletotrichum limetticola]|uniref:Uncharacterized protein n=1 Tax=Colletotrichum limetticola TaxID=1209924 RepID=A0ABQ9PSJ9_9PEZI|nr:hypothetical protein CLIM01_08145 [Colletotrichum limetticola]